MRILLLFMASTCLIYGCTPVKPGQPGMPAKACFDYPSDAVHCNAYMVNYYPAQKCADPTVLSATTITCPAATPYIIMLAQDDSFYTYTKAVCDMTSGKWAFLDELAKPPASFDPATLVSPTTKGSAYPN